MSRIVKLEAENIKRLKAVSITPSGNTIVVGGDNDQGKSSLLDSIEYAIAGKSSIPSKPVRDGQKKARVVLELDDLIVTRTFTEGDSRLVLTTKTKTLVPSPQDVLDKMRGTLTFDPLEFDRMDDKERAETLRSLLGLDFSESDQMRQALYDERTMTNREVKSLRDRLAAAPTPPDDTPNEEVSAKELNDELVKASEHNSQIEAAKSLAAQLGRDIMRSEETIMRIEKQIAELQAALVEARRQAEALDKRKMAGTVWLEKNQKIDTTGIVARIEACEDTNRKVREKLALLDLGTSLAEVEKKAADLTKQIDDIDEGKRTMIASANFPIEGLSFSAEGDVTYEGIPWNQLSSSKRLRISVAMGFAMNPKLKVLLIRDGSLLDDKNLAMIEEMAAANDGQVWIERVSKGKEVSVIIEDGMVKKE